MGAYLVLIVCWTFNCVGGEPCVPAAPAEGSRQRSKGSQQRRRLPKAARDQQQAATAASATALSAESSAASLPTDSSAAQQRRAPPGECTFQELHAFVKTPTCVLSGEPPVLPRAVLVMLSWGI